MGINTLFIEGNLRPRLHGAGLVFIRTSFCTDKLRLHGTGQIFVRFCLSVYTVPDLNVFLCS